MSFSINNMKSQLSGGGARPTLFRVFLTNPINAIGDIKAPFMIKATQLPAASLGVIEVPYQGRKFKVPGDRTFAEWTTTVINDEDFAVRHAIEEWSNAINGFESNRTNSGATSNPSSYMSDAQIDQLSKDGRVIRTYIIRDMFPSEVGQIDLSWENNDTIEEFEVTWQYQRYEVVGATGSVGRGEPGSIFDTINDAVDTINDINNIARAGSQIFR